MFMSALQHKPHIITNECPHCQSKNTKIKPDSRTVIKATRWFGGYLHLEKWIGECEDCGKEFMCGLFKKIAIEEKRTIKR